MVPPPDILLFKQLVELKSFTATAEALQLSRASVSKRINRLEDHLGIQLLNRTTRRLSLTEAGRTLYEYSVQISDILQEAEVAVSEIRQHPKGMLNINAPVSFGQTVLPAIIADFLRQYPSVSVRLSLSDKFVDVLEDGYDLVVRIGKMDDSSLRARQVGTTRLHVFAHNDYLKRHGTPRTPADLRHHNCLMYRHLRSGADKWQFEGPEGRETVAIKGNFCADNGIPLCKAVEAGLGIAMQPSFVVDTLAEKTNIVCLLEDYTRTPLGIYAVYPPARRPPLNTRKFIDCLVKHLS